MDCNDKGDKLFSICRKKASKEIEESNQKKPEYTKSQIKDNAKVPIRAQ